MSGTSLVILAMYSVANVASPSADVTVETMPYLLALLLTAAILTCLATLGQLTMPSRSQPKGASIRGVVRRMSGPGVRRL